MSRYYDAISKCSGAAVGDIHPDSTRKSYYRMRWEVGLTGEESMIPIRVSPRI
jgi:hypothetical protein